MNSETVRAFIAAELPRLTVDSLEKIQSRMKEVVGGVRWVRPDYIHLTVAFLGDVETSRIAPVSDAVRREAAGLNRMAFFLDGLGVFPDLKRPRVIWVGLDGEKRELASLHKGLADELEGIGFRREQRSFIPHLTLGRVKYPRQVPRTLAEILDRERTRVDSSLFELEGLTLFKSELTPGGAVYTRLAYFPFQGRQRDCEV